MEAIPPTCKVGEIYTDPLSSVDARFQGLSFQDIKSHAAVSPIRYLIVKCSSNTCLISLAAHCHLDSLTITLEEQAKNTDKDIDQEEKKKND